MCNMWVDGAAPGQPARFFFSLVLSRHSLSLILLSSHSLAQSTQRYAGLVQLTRGYLALGRGNRSFRSLDPFLLYFPLICALRLLAIKPLMVLTLYMPCAKGRICSTCKSCYPNPCAGTTNSRLFVRPWSTKSPLTSNVASPPLIRCPPTGEPLSTLLISGPLSNALLIARSTRMQ